MRLRLGKAGSGGGSCSCHPGRDLARGSSLPLEKAGLGRATAVIVVIGIGKDEKILLRCGDAAVCGIDWKWSRLGKLRSDEKM